MKGTTSLVYINPLHNNKHGGFRSIVKLLEHTPYSYSEWVCQPNHFQLRVYTRNHEFEEQGKLVKTFDFSSVTWRPEDSSDNATYVFRPTAERDLHNRLFRLLGDDYNKCGILIHMDEDNNGDYARMWVEIDSCWIEVWSKMTVE